MKARWRRLSPAGKHEVLNNAPKSPTVQQHRRRLEERHIAAAVQAIRAEAVVMPLAFVTDRLAAGRTGGHLAQFAGLAASRAVRSRQKAPSLLGWSRSSVSSSCKDTQYFLWSIRYKRCRFRENNVPAAPGTMAPRLPLRRGYNRSAPDRMGPCAPHHRAAERREKPED